MRAILDEFTKARIRRVMERINGEPPSNRGPKSSDYLRCTTFSRDSDRETVSCKLGLWSVDAPTSEPGRARLEGWRYFRQYWDDGEYKDL